MPIDCDGVSPTELAEIKAIARRPAASARLEKNPLAAAAWLLERSLRRGDYAQSLLHAHEPHLHSVMLFDFGRDGGKIRMFFAAGGLHQLSTLQTADGDLRCRLHDHRFDLALLPLRGSIRHLRSREVQNPSAGTTHTKYAFGSAILRGADEFTFERLEDVRLETYRDEVLVPGEVTLLTFDEAHSVNTQAEYAASDVAWLVFEGPELRTTSALYSIHNDLPPRTSAAGLYAQASAAEATNIVRRVLEDI
jgi:hypothetical protein